MQCYTVMILLLIAASRRGPGQEEAPPAELEVRRTAWRRHIQEQEETFVALVLAMTNEIIRVSNSLSGVNFEIQSLPQTLPQKQDDDR